MLQIKGVTKTTYGNKGFCKLKTQFFSSLYPNLTINVIFPFFLVYPLHLNILSHKNETKMVSLMLIAWDLTYVHIELNLVPMVVTLVLIIIKIFLFVISNEIFNNKFLENSYAVFKLKSQSNCFKLTFQITLFYFISLYSSLQNSSDNLKATSNFYCIYCSIWRSFLSVKFRVISYIL